MSKNTLTQILNWAKDDTLFKSITWNLKQFIKKTKNLISTNKNQMISSVTILEKNERNETLMMKKIRLSINDLLRQLHQSKQTTSMLQLGLTYVDGELNHATTILPKASYWERDLLPKIINLYHQAYKRATNISKLEIRFSDLRSFS